MRTDIPQPIKLADYRPPDYLVDEIHLDFDLATNATRVKARMAIRRNGDHAEPLRFNGERLKAVSVAIDGRLLGADEHSIDDEFLTIAAPPAAFSLETEVEIDPAANKALEGLYVSAGRFCTQCEAEGFRKITWYPDRPDVLARFTVRIEGDRAYPRLLSNGNLLEAGELPGGRHYAVWNDPFPKPSYLFALVAGELDVLEDSFVTMSGRKVDLRIFVDTGMAERATYAMDSLKRAMKWDEEAFGREYDLDLFMIVAVRDFNFGAMENKGLNIFNSSLLLADPQTATDVDYERIEGVIAHEYFHNWTGDRITCRDWFQLCLKEGLTVFRDQSFSADMRGAAVSRIKDVRQLRARQFSEDAGPLAHPVRPNSYIKIDNFYTATIYEKGAEVIRMLKTVIGAESFRAGMDLYFDRFDGQATTMEAFIQCFAEASGHDLGAFFAWYEQAGTPKVSLQSSYDAEKKALQLILEQSTAPTPGQPDKQALPIPIQIGLLDEDGRQLKDTELVVLDSPSRTVTIENVTREPVISALRGFSEPVNLTTDAPAKDGYVLLAADPDLFNRWDAGQTLSRNLILARADGHPDEVGEERYAEALERALRDQSSDNAFKALLLALPSEQDLAVASPPADPAAIHDAREALRARMAKHLGEELLETHARLQDAGEFSPDAASAGRRALRNATAMLLSADPTQRNRERVEAHFRDAGNMTEAMGGLSALMHVGGEGFEQALSDFYERWKSEPLVIDKWFSLQAQDPSDGALGRVLGLTAHPDFEAKNPNRLRALVATFANFNPARFHDPSGAGYRFLADQVLMADTFNPNMAARLIEPLGQWERYTPELGQLMRAELERITQTPGLSKNVFEIASRSLG